jgi:glucan 1,3-beta-glucosidase
MTYYTVFTLLFLSGLAISSQATLNLSQAFTSWQTYKARGVNIGNWLVLEEWMDSSWFNSTSPNAVDEWTFCQNLGTTNCTSALQSHWNSWILESDIALAAQYGINILRVPLGFWAFVDPLPTEPYVRAGQTDQLTRLLGKENTDLSMVFLI